jgi:hypothetical protein
VGEYSLQWSGVREVPCKLALSSPDLRFEVLQHCFELLFHLPASGKQWEEFLQTYREVRSGRGTRMLFALSTRQSQKVRSTSMVKLTMAFNASPKLKLLDTEIEGY